VSDDKGFIEIIPTGEDELTPEQVMTKAIEDDLDYVLLIGRKGEGWYFACNDPNPMKAIICAEQFRNYMMSN